MGGAAGHMNHPFDLGWVNTGSDLLDFFDKAQTFVEKKGAGAVKIDGVNVSFKVVGDDERKQFAVDRGSLKNIDIEGITYDRVDDRFPEGHGMRPAITTLLSILNSAIGDIQPELEALGMWNDPSLFLNTEYVEGTTNVTEYDENFLAIHGLNQFYQKTAKSGASKGNIRPGAERPEGVKAPSIEIGYTPEIMEKLIDKLNPIANEYGFQVYGSVPTERSADSDIDYSSTLAEPFTVRVSDDREITKSLGEWLSEASNPRYKTVQLKNGKKTHALHKELYKAILDGSVPIVDLIEDADAEAAIYGAVMMHATRMLGTDVLRGLTSPMGDVMGHEGIVLRDDKLFGPNPVKVTGEFIVGGMGSNFQADTSLEEAGSDEPSPWDSNADEWYEDRFVSDQEAWSDIEDEDDDPVTDSNFPKTVAIVPGAFKPPHKGHLEMVRKYAAVADEVIILISSPTKSGRYLPNGEEITAEQSKKIWELLAAGIVEPENIKISSHASPLTAAYEYVGKDGPLEPGTKVILGASTKGGDANRWDKAEGYIKDGVELLDPLSTAVEPTTRLDGTPYSASDMRELLGRAKDDPDAIEELEDFIGEDKVFDLLSILGLGSPVKEANVASAVQGAVGANGGPWADATFRRFNDEEKEKSKLKRNENIDLNIIDDVMRLIMEKGIMR
jgi:cytidyltransferase-like protein